MKTTKHWLATIAVLLCSISVSAHDFEVDGIYYKITSSTDFTVAVTYNGSSSTGVYVNSVIIPETVTYNSRTYRVTSVDSNAFNDCEHLTSVIIPEGVTSIGWQAFAGCTLLSSIVIPEGVASIEYGTFRDCVNLPTISIPQSVISISSNAFRGCSSLKEVRLEDGITTLLIKAEGSILLFDESPIEKLYIGRNLSFDGYSNSPLSSGNSWGVFESNLTSVIIGDLVSEIAPYIFLNCRKLSSLKIGTSVVVIGRNAFDTCYGLTEVIIPNSVKEIGMYAFYYCCEIEKITLGENVETIGRAAFNGCNRLAEINIPNSVTSIEQSAFYDCLKLTAFIIPEKVASIGSYAFGRELTSLTCLAKTPPTCTGETFYYVSKSIPVYVPESSVGAYRVAEGWSDFTNFVAIPEVNISVLDTQESLSQLQDEDFDNLTYTRTFNNTNWQALYVPFEIPYENIKDDFEVAYINDTRQYDRDDDGYSDIPLLNSTTVGFRSFFKTSDYSKITAEYHHTSEYRRGGYGIDSLQPHESPLCEQLRHNIDAATAKWDMYTADNKHFLSVYSSFQHIGRHSYFGTNYNPNAYGKSTDIVSVTGAQYRFSYPCGIMNADLSAGAEYSYNQLRDQILGYDRNTLQKVHIGGGYVQNEWKNDAWSILVGGRLEQHSLLEKPVFSPRANVRWSPIVNGKSTISDNSLPLTDLIMRLSYASGYRAPQIYEEDLHVGAVGGEVSLISLDENLRPEYSHSVPYP